MFPAEFRANEPTFCCASCSDDEVDHRVLYDVGVLCFVVDARVASKGRFTVSLSDAVEAQLHCSLVIGGDMHLNSLLHVLEDVSLCSLD